MTEPVTDGSVALAVVEPEVGNAKALAEVIEPETTESDELEPVTGLYKLEAGWR